MGKMPPQTHENTPLLPVGLDSEDSLNTNGDIGKTPFLNKSLRSQANVDHLLPSVSDRKAIVGCLAAVLASMHTYDTENVDEEHFYSAYAAHCNIHPQFEEKNSDQANGTVSEKTVVANISLSSSSIETNGGSLKLNTKSGSDEMKGEEMSEQRNLGDDTNDNSTVHSLKDELIEVSEDITVKPVIFSQNSAGVGLKSTCLEKNGNVVTHDVFGGNRRKREIAIRRHKRRKYEMKLDLLRCATRLMMLDEAEATALTPILKPLLSLEGDEDMEPDEIIQPFLLSLSCGKAGFQCVALLLFNYLLLSSTISSAKDGKTSAACENFVGYDARIRQAFKRLATAVFSHDIMRDYLASLANTSDLNDSEALECPEPSCGDSSEGSLHICLETLKSSQPTESDIRKKSDTTCIHSVEKSAVLVSENFEDSAPAVSDTVCESEPTYPDKLEESEPTVSDALEDSAVSIGEIKDSAPAVSDAFCESEPTCPDILEESEPTVSDALEDSAASIGEIKETDDSDHENESPGVSSQFTKMSQIEAAAVRKFESLEHKISCKLLSLSELVEDGQNAEGAANKCSTGEGSEHKRIGSDQVAVWTKTVTSREKLIRAAKICSAGIVAGAVFSVTGGLAAPAVAATLATIAGSAAAATAAAVTLTSTIAVSTIFGVGGIGLGIKKMHKRTQGLTELISKRESHGKKNSELSRTVCISGWLRDEHDFQRPWGVCPEKLTDKQELLERFYSVHDPAKLTRCDLILEKWKGREEELWELLRDTYGRDPDHLFPLKGPMRAADLTNAENEAVDALMVALGYPHLSQCNETCFRLQSHCSRPMSDDSDEHSESTTYSSMKSSRSFLSLAPLQFNARNRQDLITEEEKGNLPSHLPCVWDFQSKYGGELYTLKWESELLRQLTGSVTSVGADVASTATLQVLQETAFSAIASVLALQSNIIRVTKVIDGPWSLAIQRADEAGVELARSLLESKAGHRPVTLVGFSLGARIILSCLKELALHQERWEDNRERTRLTEVPRNEENKKSTRRGRWWGKKRESSGRGQDVSETGTEIRAPTVNSASSSSSSIAREMVKADNTTEEKDFFESTLVDKLPLELTSEQLSTSCRPSPNGGVAEDLSSSTSRVRRRGWRRNRKRDGKPNTDDKPDHSSLLEGANLKEPLTRSEDDAELMAYSREPASIIEDAILIGCPAYVNRLAWAACRRVVAGRFVNCYCPKDFVLSLMFQYESMSGLLRPTCGTHPVKLSGVENYDLSGVVSNHSEYCLSMDKILDLIRFGQPEFLANSSCYSKSAEDCPNVDECSDKTQD